MPTKINIIQKVSLFFSLLLGNSLNTALAQELHPPPTAPTWALQSRLATDPSNTNYFICHPCKLTAPDKQHILELEGVYFTKPDYSFNDVLNILQPAKPAPSYIFAKESKLTVKPIDQGRIDYSDSRYLNYLGYADYLTIPIISLYAKANSNDIKAQFIYALFWQEIARLDPNGNGLSYFKDIIQVIADKNADANIWLGVIYDSENKTEQAIKLYTDFLKTNSNPLAQYQLAMLLLKNTPKKPEQQRACQLLQKASENGLDLAQYNYGVCLYLGEEIVRDRKRGERYLALAAANNVSNAQEWFQNCKVDLPKIELDKLIYKNCPQNKP
jgi:hypothetical protein